MIKQIFQPKEVVLKEMLLNNEKLNWEKRFFKSYKYSKNQDKKLQQIRFKHSKYYYIVVDNVDVGYLRITEINKTISVTDNDMTHLGEIYIKPNHRNNGYARLAILKLIKEHKLNMICMEREVYYQNEHYYQTLGFKYTAQIDNHYITTEYGLSVLKDIQEKINEMNNEKNKLSKQVEKVVSLCNGRNIKQVVNDLMQMFCNLISEPRLIEVAFNNTLWKCNEDFRLELSYYKKYPEAWEELQMLSTMFMQAIKDSEPFTDLIGDLYDMQLRGNTLGQFLTPHDVADALAQFNIITEKQPEAFKVYSVSEPCVGAGGLILGFIRNYHQAYGKGATKNLDIHINDLDIHMVKMATVQIVMNSIIHRIPIHRLTATHANLITEYEDMNMGKKDMYVWIPDTNKTSLMKMIDDKKEYVEKENEQSEKEVNYA